MSDGQFWFVMTCLVLVLDALTYRTRSREQRENREWWAAYDRDSKKRHDDFMTALAEERGRCRHDLLQRPRGHNRRTAMLRTMQVLEEQRRVRRYWREGDVFEIAAARNSVASRLSRGGNGCWVYALDGMTERQWRAA